MALSRIWVSMICVALVFGAASGRGAQLGAAAAVTFIIMAVPVLFFLLCQSSILETMTTSGMKD